MSMGGALGAVSSIGGGIMSFLGGQQQEDQQSAAYYQKAQDATYQANLARRSARYINALLPAELQQQQEGFDKQLGTIRATYGASGLDMEGTPLAVLKGTVRDQAFATEMTKFTAATQVQSLRDQARQQEQNAQIYSANAASSQGNTFFDMLGSAFGIGSSLSGNSAVRSSLGIK